MVFCLFAVFFVILCRFSTEKRRRLLTAVYAMFYFMIVGESEIWFYIVPTEHLVKKGIDLEIDMNIVVNILYIS